MKFRSIAGGAVAFALLATGLPALSASAAPIQTAIITPTPTTAGNPDPSVPPGEDGFEDGTTTTNGDGVTYTLPTTSCGAGGVGCSSGDTTDNLTRPSVVYATFYKWGAYISWPKVLGNTYHVYIEKRDYAGPWIPYTTTGNYMKIAYWRFPYKTDDHTSGYRAWVYASDAWGHNSAATVGRSRADSRVASVTQDWKQPGAELKIPAIMKSCAKLGMQAVVLTYVVAGVGMAAATFIPPVEAMTQAAVFNTAFYAGNVATIGCLLWDR